MQTFELLKNKFNKNSTPILSINKLNFRIKLLDQIKCPI